MSVKKGKNKKISNKLLGKNMVKLSKKIKNLVKNIYSRKPIIGISIISKARLSAQVISMSTILKEHYFSKSGLSKIFFLFFLFFFILLRKFTTI